MGFTVTPIGTPGTAGAFTITSRGELESIDDLAPESLALIDGAHTVTLATHGAGERIHLSPMWFKASPDRKAVEINTVKGRAKDHQMRANGTVSIQITDATNPYSWITIYGEVEDVIEESDPERGHLATESIDDLSELYVKRRPYAFRVEGEERVIFRIAVSQISTFG